MNHCDAILLGRMLSQPDALSQIRKLVDKKLASFSALEKERNLVAEAEEAGRQFGDITLTDRVVVEWTIPGKNGKYIYAHALAYRERTNQVYVVSGIRREWGNEPLCFDRLPMQDERFQSVRFPSAIVGSDFQFVSSVENLPKRELGNIRAATQIELTVGSGAFTENNHVEWDVVNDDCHVTRLWDYVEHDIGLHYDNDYMEYAVVASDEIRSAFEKTWEAAYREWYVIDNMAALVEFFDNIKSIRAKEKERELENERIRRDNERAYKERQRAMYLRKSNRNRRSVTLTDKAAGNIGIRVQASELKKVIK